MTYFIADNILAILMRSKEYKRGEGGWLAAIEIFRALAMRSEAHVLCKNFSVASSYFKCCHFVEIYYFLILVKFYFKKSIINPSKDPKNYILSFDNKNIPTTTTHLSRRDIDLG